MVRAAKRRPDHERAVCRQQPCDRVHRGDLKSGFGVKRGQQPRQALRQHGLATARRPLHEQMMAASRRYFDRQATAGLARHIGKIADILDAGLR